MGYPSLRKSLVAISGIRKSARVNGDHEKESTKTIDAKCFNGSSSGPVT
jgi:hypothetical protein